MLTYVRPNFILPSVMKRSISPSASRGPPLTASKLRENVYKILDQVLETGVPVEISRRGRRLRIVPLDRPAKSKLENLKEHREAIRGDPEEIVHIDWSNEWRP